MWGLVALVILMLVGVVIYYEVDRKPKTNPKRNTGVIALHASQKLLSLHQTTQIRKGVTQMNNTPTNPGGFEKMEKGENKNNPLPEEQKHGLSPVPNCGKSEVCKEKVCSSPNSTTEHQESVKGDCQDMKAAETGDTTKRYGETRKFIRTMRIATSENQNNTKAAEESPNSDKPMPPNSPDLKERPTRTMSTDRFSIPTIEKLQKFIQDASKETSGSRNDTKSNSVRGILEEDLREIGLFKNRVDEIPSFHYMSDGEFLHDRQVHYNSLSSSHNKSGHSDIIAYCKRKWTQSDD
jgi:hypothetical protein